MRILALDLSKRSAGWALYGPNDERAVSGAWVLGTEWTSKGRTFAKLHQYLSELHQVSRIDAVFYEEPLNLGPHNGFTNKDTINVLIGLAMHAESWGDAMGCRMVRAVNQSSWRSSFLGSIPRGPTRDALGAKVKRKAIDFKGLARARCQQLGFNPATHDEAEAIGVLDYACDCLQIMPYWRKNEVLRVPLMVGQ